jgi:predicted DNA-binding transcriptional regulator AlpA
VSDAYAAAAQPGSKAAAIRSNRAAARALVDDPLLTARESAAELGGSLSWFWKRVKAGTLPAPIYVGPKMPRWRLSTIRPA